MKVFDEIKQDLKNLIAQPPKSTSESAFFLHSAGFVSFEKEKSVLDELAFSCVSESSKSKSYQVKFNYNADFNILPTCTCSHFENGNICKHIKATAMTIASNYELLNELYDIKIYIKNHLYKPIQDKSKIPNPHALTHQHFNFDLLDSDNQLMDKMIGYHQQEIFRNSTSYFKNTSIKNGTAKFYFSHENEKTCSQEIIGNAEFKNQVAIKCDCKGKKPCFHQFTMLSGIRRFGYAFLDVLLDTTGNTQNLVAAAGITGKMASNFEISVSLNGKTKIIGKDPSDLKVFNLLKSTQKISEYHEKYAKHFEIKEPKREYTNLFYVLCFEVNDFSFLIIPCVGKTLKNGDLGKKYSYLNSSEVKFNELDDSDASIETAKLITQKLETSNIDSIYDARASYTIKNYFNVLPHFSVDQHWSFFANQKYVFIRDRGQSNDIGVKINLHQTPIEVRFECSEVNNIVTINPIFIFKKDESEYELLLKKENFKSISLVYVQNTYYFIPNETAIILENVLNDDMEPLQIKKEIYDENATELIYNLMAKHKVIFKSESLKIKNEKLALTSKKIYFKEQSDFFMLVPAYVYEYEGESYEAEMDGVNVMKITHNDTTILIERDSEIEIQLKNDLQNLHPNFKEQLFNHYFYLPQAVILTDNWFFNAFDFLKENGYEILGLKNLKKLKYSPHKAKISVSAGSGIDWFDLTIDISFGDEKVGLSELRKALFNNQKFVTLANGSLGMLPDEWIAKYERIIKGGKVKKNTIEFGQIQYGLIDHLYDDILNNHNLLEFHNKRQKLLSYEAIKQTKIPKNVKAELREYQKGGVQWLHFLDEFGWGGCLADDMGLGKTLQMLTFIQSKVNENKKMKFLVVVPASLIFNWQREAEKFTPDLSVLNQTGSSREKELELFEKYNVILTTYALMRIDIENLKEFKFDYVILDESQAIKNPSSQTAKAAKILKSKNRLIMTGTPIENNTFDLYSQFDFLNPGLLGSVDYFREQFANPIDKNRDEKAAESLRKLIYPFILSRKKEQVAKDLPAKTETIIYCEMPKSQRKVYDTYKKKIKDDLAQTIEADGLGKSGMAILQGLMKLRQICNSPALLSDDDITVHESIKLDTLMENIVPIVEEKHKVLIFSFFVEMLELIKERLQKEQIQFAWITGQTTKREEQVQQFQQDENCKVFLISLKAGGVGLNLTAADYVYLVDPWWNPAVEQQAIDRAHRIGQTQNVFAYKMICKDTIEEKILQLQEKKKAVANELVNIEQGVLKKLSKDDVMDLFN